MGSREVVPGHCPHHTPATVIPGPQIWSLRQGDQEAGRACGFLRHVPGTPVSHMPSLMQHLCLQKPHMCPREQSRYGGHGVRMPSADREPSQTRRLPAGPVGRVRINWSLNRESKTKTLPTGCQGPNLTIHVSNARPSPLLSVRDLRQTRCHRHNSSGSSCGKATPSPPGICT